MTNLGWLKQVAFVVLVTMVPTMGVAGYSDPPQGPKSGICRVLLQPGDNQPVESRPYYALYETYRNSAVPVQGLEVWRKVQEAALHFDWANSVAPGGGTFASVEFAKSVILRTSDLEGVIEYLLEAIADLKGLRFAGLMRFGRDRNTFKELQEIHLHTLRGLREAATSGQITLADAIEFSVLGTYLLEVKHWYTQYNPIPGPSRRLPTPAEIKRGLETEISIRTKYLPFVVMLPSVGPIRDEEYLPFYGIVPQGVTAGALKVDRRRILPNQYHRMGYQYGDRILNVFPSVDSHSMESISLAELSQTYNSIKRRFELFQMVAHAALAAPDSRNLDAPIGQEFFRIVGTHYRTYGQALTPRRIIYNIDRDLSGRQGNRLPEPVKRALLMLRFRMERIQDSIPENYNPAEPLVFSVE